MVAQVDEQQIAVVALAMHPPRQARRVASMVRPELAAGMGAVGMHKDSRVAEPAGISTPKPAFCQAAFQGAAVSSGAIPYKLKLILLSFWAMRRSSSSSTVNLMAISFSCPRTTRPGMRPSPLR